MQAPNMMSKVLTGMIWIVNYLIAYTHTQQETVPREKCLLTPPYLTQEGQQPHYAPLSHN